MPIISIIYPHLDSNLRVKGMGIGWLHHTDLDFYNVENMIGLPGNMILEQKELLKIKKIDKRKYDHVFLVKLDKKKAKQNLLNKKLIPVYLVFLDEKEKQHFAKDISNINVNRGWGDGPEGYREEYKGRRSATYRDESPSVEAELDRDRDRDRSEKPTTYTMSDVIRDLSTNESNYVPEKTFKKANDYIQKWIDLKIDGGTIEETGDESEFLSKVVEGNLYLEEHVEEILYLHILDGKIHSSDDTKKVLALNLFNWNINNSILTELVMREILSMFRSIGIPQETTCGLTRFNTKSDIDLIPSEYSKIFQPVPTSFVTDKNAIHVTHFGINLQTNELATMAATNQCNIISLMSLFIFYVFDLKNVAFIKQAMNVCFVHNYHLFHGEHFLRPGSFEHTLQTHLNNPDINLIFIPVTITEDVYRPYRFIHNVLSKIKVVNAPKTPDPYGHANLLVLDKKSMTFELFEPHMRGSKDISSDLHKEKIDILKQKRGTFICVQNFMKKLGFKAADFVTCLTPGEKSVQNADKLCKLWSLFYMALKMVNPLTPEKYLRMSMCYNTLLWFMIYILLTMPNIFKDCATEHFIWENGITLNDAMKHLSSYTPKEIYLPYSSDPLVLFPRATVIPNKS